MNDIASTDRTKHHQQLHAAIASVNQLILGKKQQVKLAFTALIADGHLLIEDLPGVGKTTLAEAIALVSGLAFKRVQFTSDLLPADLIGVSVYSAKKEEFLFHPGPVFTQVLLADEVNRATPKAQSALLEAMSERQVTVENETYPLDPPFFVIATQNPVDLAGTFPLPDSQLDRFLMRISVGYPDAAAERQILERTNRRGMLSGLQASLDATAIDSLQSEASALHLAGPLLDYAQALIAATRNHASVQVGLSPRGGLALVRCAQAWALIDGRDYCRPEDLREVFAEVTSHRLQLTADATSSTDQIVGDILGATAIP